MGPDCPWMVIRVMKIEFQGVDAKDQGHCNSPEEERGRERGRWPVHQQKFGKESRIDKDSVCTDIFFEQGDEEISKWQEGLWKLLTGLVALAPHECQQSWSHHVLSQCF